jgi:hypothetical protein
MKFRTEIEPFKDQGFFKHSDQILRIGSCFANNVAIELEKDGFLIDQNTMGILFNPISIMKNIRNSFQQNLNESLIIQRDDYFYHFDYPSQFYAESQEKLVEKIKRIQEDTTKQLKKSNRLILTFGTAWVYNWLKKDEIVANCHKIPAQEFKKELLELNYLIKSYVQFFEELRAVNPNLEIILTVSPVRHIKNGLHENNLSKSDLDDIYEVYESIGKKENKDIAARLVPLSEIEDNNFDLNIGRYIKADAAEVVDVSAALKEFNQARADLEILEKELLAKLRAAGYA